MVGRVLDPGVLDRSDYRDVIHSVVTRSVVDRSYHRGVIRDVATLEGRFGRGRVLGGDVIGDVGRWRLGAGCFRIGCSDIGCFVDDRYGVSADDRRLDLGRLYGRIG